MNSQRTTLIVAAIVVIGSIAYFAFRPQGMSDTAGNANNSDTTTNVNMITNENDGMEVTGEDVEYADGSRGYYARPTNSGSYPGVVMIHEWWGLNDNIKTMARELAGQGYNVIAVDLFKGSVATTQEQAMTQVRGLNQEEALTNLKSAKNFLVTKGATRIASLGWCFGGGQSLQLALSGEPLDATVIYYGSLVTSTDRLAAIDWPVLGVFGDQDQSIPVATVNEFEQSLNTLNIDNHVHVYEGVGHAFANPSGSNYAPGETRDAWQKTLDFLRKNLQTI